MKELKNNDFINLDNYKYDSVICINKDKTISYVGIIGHLHIKSGFKDLKIVDYSKLINKRNYSVN